ncbi:hypothetical protein K9N68_29445 [Kovacikia minuta CCNUW1]|uniref:hypothetical protein n=1 Tax=Kovacikia minuta TaxID=2931930 RepID=UPI001CCA88BC|nr:hypothetical protein [Kovacikia minuta]UBF25643.1 hypothetical protein K9N68_29445 [Kovacikia minuta CCNUW1]
MILNFILNEETKISYPKRQVAVQLTTSLTEKEFTQKNKSGQSIADHTRFKHAKPGSSLTEALKSSPEKTKTNKHDKALIKHAYELLTETSNIPQETRVEKVPFKYQAGFQGKLAALHTEANKIAKLINREGETAFLVEYWGGGATPKSFIGDIKSYLEGKRNDLDNVVASIKDAFPHLS